MLFWAIFTACVAVGGAGRGALVARSESGKGALARAAPAMLRRGAIAWLVVVAVGAAPIVRYAILARGGPRFR